MDDFSKRGTKPVLSTSFLVIANPELKQLSFTVNSSLELRLILNFLLPSDPNKSIHISHDLFSTDGENIQYFVII